VFKLSQGQFVILDQFEGCGRGYESFWLDLLVDGREQAVLTYLTPSHWRLDNGRPYDWYRDLVLAGARFHQFPPDVIERLETMPAQPDPDRQRSVAQAELLEQLQNG
jgi:gamma-glutamylcyclotransferase